MNKLLMFIGLWISSNSIACSFAPTTEEFVIDSLDTSTPETAVFVVDRITRGFDDGDGGSCSDAGTLTLKLTSPVRAEMGYIFQITEGTFEGELFPKVPLKPSGFSKPDIFMFIWLDGESDNQEPIDLTVEITPVAKSGVKGSPIYLKVTHPGVKKSWWKFW